MRTTGSTAPPAGRPQVDVVAITLGDDFLIDLGEVLSGQATVRPVDTAAAAVEQLWSSRRGQVLVVDTRDLPDVRQDVEMAMTEAPHAVVVLFTQEGEEEQIADALQDLPIHAVLPIPLDRRKTGLALDAALADAAARKPGDRRAPAAPMEQEQEEMPLSSYPPQAQEEDPFAFMLDDVPPPEPRRASTGLWVGVGFAVVAVVGAGFWLLRPRHTAAPAAASVPARPVLQGADASSAPATSAEAGTSGLTAVPLVRGTVDDLLEKARQAMRARHYTDPEKESALLYYRSAQAVDPANAEANDGLQRVATVVMARYEDALAKGRMDEASADLNSLKQALPGDARLAGLEQRLVERQMTQLVANGNFDAASKLLEREAAVLTPELLQKYRDEVAHRQDDVKITRLASLADAAIRDGRLVEPDQDNARTYVQQMTAVAPRNPVTIRTVRDLNAAFLRRAREARGGSETEKWLLEARNTGASAADIEAVRRDVGQQHQKAETDKLATLFHDRLNNNHLTEAQDSAAYYLTLMKAADPTTYPPAARELASKLLDRARGLVASGKSGSADLDLKQAQVYGADPKEIAAVQALESAVRPALNPPLAPPSRPSQAASAAIAASIGGSSQTDAPATVSPGGGMMPRKISGAKPEFPQRALQQNIGGSVTVQFVINAKGEPQDVRVTESNPPGVFDRAAIMAVKRSRYQPVIVDGKPVEVPYGEVVRFPKPQP